MSAATDALTSISQTLGAMLGLTRHARLRRQMRDTMHLMELASKHRPLDAAYQMMAKSVEAQARDLLVLTRYQRGRKWDWAGFTVGLVITGGLGYGLWAALWRNPWDVPSALQWLLLVVVGLVVIACASATLSQLLERRPDTKPSDLPDWWSTGGLPPTEVVAPNPASPGK